MSTSQNIAQWSTTAADNDDADTGINFAEGQTAGSVNNSARAVMATLAKWRKDIGGALSAGGTANALTVTTNGLLEAAHMADGLLLVVKATADNDNATVTFNPDTRGAANVKRADGSALAVGSIKTDQYLFLIYNQGAAEWRAANIPPVRFDESGELTLTSSALSPSASDGTALDTASLMWSDLFLASGGVIDFNNGDVTVTHSANALAFAGATSGYSFDDDLLLPSAGVVNFGAGNYTVTHSSGLLTTNGNLSVNGASGVLSAGTIELGHASANTLSASDGVLSIEGAALARVANATDADTLLDTLGTEAQGTILYRDATSWVMLARPGTAANPQWMLGGVADPKTQYVLAIGGG